MYFAKRGCIKVEEREIKLIKLKELCEMLKISANTAYHLLNSGNLEGFRVGRMWRIPLEKVKKYVNKGKEVE